MNFKFEKKINDAHKINSKLLLFNFVEEYQMGNNITDSKPVQPHSRLVLSEHNLNKMEMDVLEFSGVPKDWIW